MAGGEQTLDLLHNADGHTYVNIVPIRLGKLTIRFMADFPDGGHASQTITVLIGPSRVRPAALGLSSGSALYIDTKNPQPAYLYPTAFHYGVHWAIPVGPRFATFKVKSTGDTPVVQIDPATGALTPLQIGDAMVKTNYLGVTRQDCVRVRDVP